MKHSLGLFILLSLLVTSASCQAAPALGESIELANSAENSVEVSVRLERRNNDQFFLSATFTPQDPSLHLYSKDIPKNGLNGLGRPTLFELAEVSSITAIGELSESVQSQPPSSGPSDLLLLVYPAGPVTLSIPVLLADGKDWVDDQVFVTYMACNEQGCRPPVQQKPIAVKIPGKGLFQ